MTATRTCSPPPASARCSDAARHPFGGGPHPSSAIARLKEQPGKDLIKIKYGTSRLDDTLVKDHLIDEFRFWIMPVVAGSGQRLFQDVDTSRLDLRLTSQKRLETALRRTRLRPVEEA